MKIHLLIGLIALPATLHSQVSFFEGSPPLPGNVVIVDTSELRPAELQNIVLMPIERCGRTRLTELLDGEARLRNDVPGASRLSLPQEHGSLYKYRRDDPAWPDAFGYFVVGADGIARRVFELAGTGAYGTEDPLPGRVAVGREGRWLLVGTSETAGGDLWEIDLVSGTAINRTPDLAPQTFGRNGLILMDDWGVAVSADGVFRFARDAGERASAVSMPIVASWFGPDLVRSADQSTVAFLAGEAADRALVWTFERSGGARQASDRPMLIQDAGFLPEDATGPALALSTDGSWVAWRSEGTSRECFMRQTVGIDRPVALQVTDDAHFHYTLDDTGVIAFFDDDSVTFFAGRGYDNGIERGELFRADLAANGKYFTASNLSETSDIEDEPFDYGYLDTADGIYQVPGDDAFVLYADYDGGELLWVDARTGEEDLLGLVQSLDFIEVAGAHLVAGVTRPPGVDDPFDRSLNLVQIPPGGSNSIVVRLPNGCHLTRQVGSRARNLFAGVVEFDSGELLGQLHVPSPKGMVVSPGLLDFGPTTGMTSKGAILATVDAGTNHTAFRWSDAGTELVRVSRVENFLLPGL